MLSTVAQNQQLQWHGPTGIVVLLIRMLTVRLCLCGCIFHRVLYHQMISSVPSFQIWVYIRKFKLLTMCYTYTWNRVYVWRVIKALWMNDSFPVWPKYEEYGRLCFVAPWPPSWTNLESIMLSNIRVSSVRSKSIKWHQSLPPLENSFEYFKLYLYTEPHSKAPKAISASF